MLPEHLTKFQETPIQVGSDGHVQLIDVMGDDLSIVDAARVSYGTGTKKVSEDRHLIRYLLRHQHTTPFEMCEIKLRVRAPMDVWRQWIRTRTASVNEYSTRYSEAINSTHQTKPEAWRLQATNNKQGSDGFLIEWPDTVSIDTLNVGEVSPGQYLSSREQFIQETARMVYEERLAFGVAREQARKDLPLSTYTEAYWKIDAHNLLRFLHLRMDAHAQLEIREYANAIAQIVQVWLPWTWEAFQDYRLNARNFSRMELQGLRALVKTQDAVELVVRASGLQGREEREYRKYLESLL